MLKLFKQSKYLVFCNMTSYWRSKKGCNYWGAHDAALHVSARLNSALLSTAPNYFGPAGTVYKERNYTCYSTRGQIRTPWAGTRGHSNTLVTGLPSKLLYVMQKVFVYCLYKTLPV